MIFDNFKISSSPFFHDVHCPECKEGLEEINNGMFSVAFYCPNCVAIYQLKLRKMSKREINQEYFNEIKEKYGEKN